MNISKSKHLPIKNATVNSLESNKMGFFKEFFTEIAIRVKNPGDNKYYRRPTNNELITNTNNVPITNKTINTNRRPINNVPITNINNGPITNNTTSINNRRIVEPDLRRAWLLD